ncbi:HECT-domain (ubiquitin-transferase) family protein [Babesia bovis T2Bo]|uniref:HECT-type E3 ubiquitin transferase n=1 Tax=Babesia bovis TaxID=5865 RepID=A7AQQ7_BABBO|nr:HECT-domain (ubiquitin-transferase) family protein [Babesia bovis T2Bo]EDO06876.1 HECT-domain (ubiquitin-transferase) family protein [Babesia bovis T2Bo]|eukprot:XP_001610444.1 HECT-domain (ubiquitin-transferase) containing protein [Babesia bovis T2Bo]
MKIGVPRGDNYKLVLAGLQLTQRDYIELLTTCSIEELSIHLESFTQWVWEKSDILCWAPVLNRFDDIFRSYLDPFRTYMKGENDSILSFYNVDLLSLVRTVLKASVMIVENCTSKSVYNSVDLLISFLDDVDPDIVFLSTKLLCVYFSRQRRNTTPKDVPEVSARIALLSQSPFPDATCHVYKTVSKSNDHCSAERTSVSELSENFASVSYSDVIDYYVAQNEYYLKTDSYVEIGQDVTRGHESSKLRIPVIDILNIYDDTLSMKTSSPPNTEGHEKLMADVLAWKNSLSTESDLYQHMLKTLRLIMKKNKIEACYFAELKYKFCKVYSLYFPYLQRRLVDIRICALICMVIMNNTSYTQFLNYNPSFLHEITQMIRRHEELERSTMVILTELLSAMVYDGLHCKTLANLFGLNMPHGIFSKVLKHYLRHPFENIPLPPLLRFKSPEDTKEYASMTDLWNHDNPQRSSDMHEEGLVDLQLKGRVVSTQAHLAEWDSSVRVMCENGMSAMQYEEDSMRILLQLLVVFYTFISYHGCSNALTNTSVIEAIVNFIRIRDPIYLPVVIYLVQVLETLLDYNQTVSRIFRKDLKIYHVFISRIQFDMHYIEESAAFENVETESVHWPVGWKIPQTTDIRTLRSYWLSIGHVSARRFLLKTLVRNIDTSARSISGRSESHDYDIFAPDGAIIPIINSIFKNPPKYGLSVYSFAVNLVSDCLGDDPILQEDLHRLEVMPALMNSITPDNLKSEECLHVIPTAVCDVLLHRSGCEYMKKHDYEPILTLIDIIPNKDFVLFDRFGEVASTVGMSLDSIVRNHEDASVFIIRRIVKIMHELVKEASTFPPFVPQDSVQCEKSYEVYMHEFRTNPPEITLDMLRSLDDTDGHEFFADRISHLGKCLSTFLCYPPTLSRFIANDGMTFVYQLCSLPCLPPLSMLVYSQHPLAIVLKFVLSQAKPPCISYIHSLCRPYLLQPTSYKIPQTHQDFVKNLQYMCMFQGISYTLYLIHRDNSTFYETCCSGQFQLGATVLSRCDMHITISAYLRRLITELPYLMKTFFMSTNEGDLETFFILSGKHTPHEHPQLKAYKLFSRDTKDAPPSPEATFSANDLFWSSQFAYAYSNPNPAYSGSISYEVSNDCFKMNTEVCRLSIVTCKAILYALTGTLNKSFRFVSSSNTCMINFIANHLYSLSLLCISILNSSPSMENFASGSSMFLEGMDCTNTARFVAEAMEMIYKLFVEDRKDGSLFMLSFIVFARMSGIQYVRDVFDYVCVMYLGCGLALALRNNPDLVPENVLGNCLKGNPRNIMLVVDTLSSYDARKIKYTMDILGRSIHICLGFFGKICNPKTLLRFRTEADIFAYTYSSAFCNLIPEDNATMHSLLTSSVVSIGSACWEWLQFIGSIESPVPGNSAASMHFYISAKVIGSLLKVHVYVLDFFSESRQEALKAHWDAANALKMDGTANARFNSDGRSATARRVRRQRRTVHGTHVSVDPNDDRRAYNLEEVRSTLIDMGFLDNDITRALDHCGYTDVSVLADWLLDHAEVGIPSATPNNTSHTNESITIDASHDMPPRQSNIEGISGPFNSLNIFPIDCHYADVSDDLWSFPSFHKFRLELDADFTKLRDDMRENYVRIVLVLSTKMSTSLPLIFDYLLRACSLPIPLTTSLKSTTAFDSSQNQNIIDLFNFIYNDLDSIYSSISTLTLPTNRDELLSLFCPVTFMEEVDKYVALESTVFSGKPILDSEYNADVARLHERLLGLFYILAHLIGGRESYSSLLLKNLKNPIDVILGLIEVFQKLRYEALKSGILTFAGIGIKPTLPGIAISLPEWCMHNELPRTQNKEKSHYKPKVEYGLIKHGFIRNTDIPQLSCTPPFFTYAMICISELLKKYSLIGLSNALSSSMDLSKHIEILSATKNVPYISRSTQHKLVTTSISILECFPGADSDLVFSLLSILDGLTEVYSNVIELLQYKRLPPQENYPAHFNRRIDVSDIVGGDSLSILLTIPRSGQCKGMLKMIANIILHCMENPIVLREAIEKCIVSLLSNNESEPVALSTLVEKVFPFTKKDPVNLLEILQRLCVLTLEEGVTNVDLSSASITLRSSSRISSLLSSNTDLISPGNIPILEATNKDRINIDSTDLMRGILRLLIVYMQIFCNIHGMTRLGCLNIEGSKPGYPFALTINSLFYLMNTMSYNFPAPFKESRLPKCEFDVPNTPFPWKVNNVNVEDSHLVLLYLIRRIFLMIFSLSKTKSKDGQPRDNEQEAHAIHKLVVSTLDSYTNCILLICSRNIKMCVTMFEELKTLLLFLMGLNAKDCSSPYLTVSICSVCNLLHNMLKLRFEDSFNAEISQESVFQVKKCLSSSFHKLDLNRDGSSILCGAIVRDLVLLTAPNKLGGFAAGRQGECNHFLDGYGNRGDGSGVDISLEVDSDSDDMDETTLSSDEEMTDPDSEELDEYMEDAMDEDIVTDTSDERDVSGSDTDPDEDDSQFDSDSEGISDDSIESGDLDTDDSDASNDVDMALPHQVDENYVSIQHSDSASHSSLDEVDDEEEDDDDAPRIRVVGELNEESHDEPISDVIEDTRPHLNVAEDDNNELLSGYSSSSDFDGFAESMRSSHERGISSTMGNNNVSINIENPNLTLPGAPANGIHIQIEISDTPAAMHYVGPENNTTSVSTLLDRPPQGTTMVSHSVANKNETWAQVGDLHIPPKHPMLPSSKKAAHPPTGYTGEVLNLIASSLPRLQLPRNVPPDSSDHMAEQRGAATAEGSVVEEGNVNVIHPPESNVVVETDTVPSQPDQQSPLPPAYFNTHLDRIATAMGITYNELFSLANMDASVIAELPEELREEIIVQQLSTIDTDALASLSENRQPSSTNIPTVLPTQDSTRYIEALPWSLRSDVYQAIHGNAGNSHSNPFLRNGTEEANLLSALGPVLRSQLFSGAPPDFLDNLVPDIFNTHGSGHNRTTNSEDRPSDSRLADIAREPLMNAHALLSNIASIAELANAENNSDRSGNNQSNQPALTFGVIIEDVGSGNNRGTNVPRTRNSGGLRRLAPSIFRRTADGSGRGMNTNDIFIFEDRRMRQARSPMRTMRTVGHIPQNVDRLDFHLGSSEPFIMGNNGRDGIDERIIQSLPQLFHSFQPHIFNMIDSSARGMNSTLAGMRPVQPETHPRMDSNADVSCDKLLEGVLRVIPHSACESSSNPSAPRPIRLVDICNVSKNEFTESDIIGICKMMYLKEEINKKIYFKLLYNLVASDHSTCNMVLKTFLYIIHTSILSTSHSCVSSIRTDKFFSRFPRLCSSRKWDFPPSHVYGSLPYKHVSFDVKLDSESNQGSDLMGGMGSASGNFSCVDLNPTSASYVSCERVLEQLRSLLIAFPNTMVFFATRISATHSHDNQSSGGGRSKRYKSSDSPTRDDSTVIHTYPIVFLFMATATKLFQSSPKLMHHLLMAIHHLLVQCPSSELHDGMDGSDAIVDTSEHGYSEDAHGSIASGPDNDVVEDSGNASVQTPSHANCTDSWAKTQQEILNTLDTEAVRIFLDIHTSWTHHSHWLQANNAGRETPPRSHMHIVAKILSVLYSSEKHITVVVEFFMNRMSELIQSLSQLLTTAYSQDYKSSEVLFLSTSNNFDDGRDLEHRIGAFVRIVNLVNDMFTEGTKTSNSWDGSASDGNIERLNEFYSELKFDSLWLSLDLALTNLCKSSPLASAADAEMGGTTPLSSGRDKLMDNSAALEQLLFLVPLIEVFMTITQIRVARDYSLDDVSDLDNAMSIVNFDYELPEGNLDFIGVAQKERVSPQKQPWDGEDSALEISPNHLSLIYFTERHSRALNCLIRQTPSLLSNNFIAIVRLAPKCLNFDLKRQYFRQKLKEGRQGMRLETLRINVRREHVFLDSYHQLRLRSGDEMKGKLSVSFGGEEGVDAGGLTREWFNILAKEMFNPNYGLFRREGRKQEFNHPNPLSGINPDHLNFFKFIGRVIGKAVYEGQHIDAYFCRSFYKHMLCRKITPADAQSVDPQFYENLTSINNCRLEDMGLELFFSTEIDEFGKVKVIDLVPDGRNIPVTDENKQKYIELLCRHKVTNGIKDQLDAFMSGFQELIAPELISIFDDKELELLISGIPTIDLRDLRENVEYVGYTDHSDQIVWLWEFLEGLDQNNLAAFLQFVTGTSRVPLGGFKNLMGMRGPQRVSIHRTFGDDRLPSAHTCFNQLDLPAYPSREKLQQKMMQAIVEGKEGFGFI